MTVSEMSEWEIDQWSSHRLILDPLLKQLRPKRIIELGAGVFSTHKLAEKCENLISIENEQVWMDTMKKELSDLDNVTLVYRQGPRLGDYIRDYCPADLLFVDFSGDRTAAVMEGMTWGIPYVVMHDFTPEDEAAITIPPGYTLFHTRGIHFNPTALYTSKLIPEAMKT